MKQKNTNIRTNYELMANTIKYNSDSGHKLAKKILLVKGKTIKLQ